MTIFRPYRRKQVAELADWKPGFDMTNVSISVADRNNGSPKAGDKIARNPANHDDRWLVAKAYFEANFEEFMTPETKTERGAVSPGSLEAWLDKNYPVPNKTLREFSGDFSWIIKKAMIRFAEWRAEVTVRETIERCAQIAKAYFDEREEESYGRAVAERIRQGE